MSPMFLAVLLVASTVRLSFTQRVIPGSYIVVFEPKAAGLRTASTLVTCEEFRDTTVASLDIPTSQTATYTMGKTSILYLHGVSLSKFNSLSSSAKALGAKVWPNRVVKLDLPHPAVDPGKTVVAPLTVCTTNCPTCVTRSLITPGLQNLDWLDLHNGDNTYCAPAPSSNKLDVFILDTGVFNTHPDLASVSIVRDDCAQPDQTIGWTPFEDKVGHGTHVTGTIASAKYGLTPNANVHMIKVLDDTGSGGDANLMCGISKVATWLNANPGKKAVVSMSLGYDSNNANINQFFTNFATTFGSRVIVVVAAGNSHVSACTVSLGAVAELLVVGSVSSVLAQSSFSNFGSCVKIFANGENVLSTFNDGTAKLLSGTSMATPLVAARCVEYFLNNPTATGTGILSTIASVTSDLHANGLISGLSTGTPNKLVKYLCPGGCNAVNPVDPNQCQPNPCLNGGVCTAFPDHHVCSCVRGWTGINCETNINECASAPCLHSGTCIDLVGGFSCSCTTTFMGILCETARPAGRCIEGARTPDTQFCDGYYECKNGGVMRLRCGLFAGVRFVFDTRVGQRKCVSPTTRGLVTSRGCTTRP